MEHIDALEAVRRLTLERDALAKQLKDANALTEKIRQSVLVDHLIPGGQDGLFHTVDWICFALRDEKKRAAAIMANRDALAEQVRRLEVNRDEWKTAFHNVCMDISVKPPQAPERRERHETDAETGEGGNGAPEDTTESQKWNGLIFGGCIVQLKEHYDGTQTCEGCKYADVGDNDNPRAWCKRHAPKPLTDLMGGARWPIVDMDDTCGDWEGKS